MKRIGIVSLLGLMPSLVACHTTYFEKGSDRVIVTQSPSWHHGGGFVGLFEWSPAYDPSQVCGGKPWKAVRIEQSLFSAVLSRTVPLGIYTPWITSTRCYE